MVVLIRNLVLLLFSELRSLFSHHAVYDTKRGFCFLKWSVTRLLGYKSYRYDDKN